MPRRAPRSLGGGTLLSAARSAAPRSGSAGGNALGCLIFFWLLPAFICSSKAGKEGSALPQLSILLPLVPRGGKAQGSGADSRRGSGKLLLPGVKAGFKVGFQPQ